MKSNFFKSDIGRVVLVVVLVFVFILPTYLKAAEKDLYDFLWLDPDKKVYVLQNKNYVKKNSFHFDLGYTKVVNQKFVSAKAISIRTGYFFHEDWGVEAIYNKYMNDNNETYASIKKVNASVPFVRKLTSTYGLLAIWSPFYGKINTFNKIYYFDWSFGLGLGQTAFDTNQDSTSNPNEDTYKNVSKLAIISKTNLKFHMTKHFHLGLEYMNTSFTDTSPSSSKATRQYNSDVMISIGLSF